MSYPQNFVINFRNHHIPSRRKKQSSISEQSHVWSVFLQPNKSFFLFTNSMYYVRLLLWLFDITKLRICLRSLPVFLFNLVNSNVKPCSQLANLSILPSKASICALLLSNFEIMHDSKCLNNRRISFSNRSLIFL
jgi:hypothetical protein